MKKENVALMILCAFALSGCYFKTATYENFKSRRDGELLPWNNYKIPKFNSSRREIYDENRYIYKFEAEDSRCVYGYLTNRNDDFERVIGWIILSGAEYCKETPGVGTWM
ncbi:hypothetical protein CR66_09450 [Campylobacter mucosalis]|uniref:hypothetical protein n=1 Tax=Campylobacter mucosalis TaxID=202 RepID=UPI0004D9E068|nr:hypothetical protein [Campylobacter mucosalis]KEA45184.1 hypothetical protein CR66_09450 [Campylobacter mucosalis]QKF63855.1 hypothetical protein CMCT_1759 [Campylobacter mucosalis]